MEHTVDVKKMAGTKHASVSGDPQRQHTTAKQMLIPYIWSTTEAETVLFEMGGCQLGWGWLVSGDTVADAFGSIWGTAG